jgi:acyl-CoA hydrolase
VAQSRARVERLMLPTEANFTGNVFGGALLAEVDRAAYIAARRHSGTSCVTASIDRVDFLAPVHVGEVVEFDARLTWVGVTSMEVWVQFRSEPIDGGPQRLVGNAFVTMVGVDAEGRPVRVPSLALRSASDRRAYAAGARRMASRRRARAGRREKPTRAAREGGR